MLPITRRAAAFAGALAITFGAAACSGTDAPTATPTPTTPATSTTTTTTPAPAATVSEILDKAKAQSSAATSGAFAGEVVVDGQPLKIDYKGTSDGATSDLTLELGGEGKARIISIGDKVWIKADKTFWSAQGAPAQVLKALDKFIEVPAEAGALADELNLKSFLDEAFSVSAAELATEVGTETVDGVECWLLADKAGKEEGALYIAKDTHHLVRFSGSTAEPGVLTFSGWNTDLGIKAPAADTVLKLG